MVGTTPQWAREAGCRSLWCPPRDLDEFGAFVRAVAERHPGQIAAWEVWNEPNHAAWFRPAPDPVHYGRLLEAATGALRAVDPDATVLSAGLAPSPSGNPARMLPARFLDRLYDTGALDAVDAIAYHPYSYPFLPSQRTGENGFIDQLRSMREVVLDHDDDKKILVDRVRLAHAGGRPDLARPAGADGDRRVRALALTRLRGPAVLVRVA